MNTRLTRITAVFAAVILVLGHFVPPAVAHAHAGGEASHTLAESAHGHQHGHAHQHGSPESNSQLPHHHAPSASRPSESLASGPSWHVHFSLFGIETTLPYSAPSPHDDEQPAEVVMLHIGAGESVLAQAARDGVNTAALAMANQLPGMSGIMILRFRDLSSTGRQDTPLCDTARHERSGVQLI